MIRRELRVAILNDMIAVRAVFALAVGSLLWTPRVLLAQDGSPLSTRLLFRPLLASQFEPRVGAEKALDENSLTLDIGNSVDLVRFPGAGRDSSSELRAGVDFFTWSHLRSTSDFRFPVEAIDYLFGLNTSWVSGARRDDRWEARLRFAHISAHAVDGLFDRTSGQWITHEPFTYSREFVDFVVARSAAMIGGNARLLAGGSVLLHSIPAIFAAVAPHAGVEWTCEFAGLAPYVAYDLRLQRIDAWRVSHALHGGVKFGGWNSAGTEVFVAYESGESVHGERYNLSASHTFLGMNVAF